MEYLLYHKKSYITGRALATHLGIKPTRSIDRLKKRGKAPIIRYGNSQGNFGNKDTEFNNPKVISLCANSYHFSRWCKENGYITPLYQRFSTNNIPKYPFLLRRLYHMRGRDIIKINNRKDINKLTANQLAKRYWVPYIETTFELRVHIVAGKIARVFKKTNPGALEQGEFIRSSVKGWHYSLRTNLDAKYQKAQSTCLSIAKELGLGFGGIDIAWDNINKEYVIWEVNTAPGLSQPTLNIYGGILREVLYGN